MAIGSLARISSRTSLDGGGAAAAGAVSGVVYAVKVLRGVGAKIELERVCEHLHLASSRCRTRA